MGCLSLLFFWRLFDRFVDNNRGWNAIKGAFNPLNVPTQEQRDQGITWQDLNKLDCDK